MDKSQFNEYLNGRYANQLVWYDNNAMQNKKLYTFFQWVIISLSAVLPVLISVLPGGFNWVSLVVSLLLGISTTSIKTFKFQENWINYRSIAEALKKERHYYNAEIYEYSNASNKEKVFVERVECLISRENGLWATIHTKNEEEKK